MEMSIIASAQPEPDSERQPRRGRRPKKDGSTEMSNIIASTTLSSSQQMQKMITAPSNLARLLCKM